MQLNSEQIYNIIKKQTGLSDSELQEKLEQIKGKYEGLLSDVGANILLSKQLEVNLDLKQRTSVFTKISEITSAIDSVSFFARVKSIPPLRTYKSKDGSEGKVQAIFLEDETGFIKLNLWQDKTEIIKELKLEKNDLIEVKDAGVSQYNEKLELSLRQGGQINKDPENITIKKLKQEDIKISEITTPPKNPVDTIARIISIFPLKTFTKEERERFAINLDISDGKKTIRVAAFDDFAKELSNNYSRGDLIRLSDVIIKDGLYDLELYINWNSTITKNPKTNIKIPSLQELTTQEVIEEKIINLEENKNYKITGTVVAINKGNLRSFKCPDCKEKVFLINTEFICEACNKQVDPITNIFSSINIDDGTGAIKVSMFNDLLEKIYEIKREDLKKDLTPEEKDEIYYKVENKLFGKQVVVTGRAKTNDFSNQLEFNANTLDLLWI